MKSERTHIWIGTSPVALGQDIEPLCSTPRKPVIVPKAEAVTHLTSDGDVMPPVRTMLFCRDCTKRLQEWLKSEAEGALLRVYVYGICSGEQHLRGQRDRSEVA